MNNGADGGSRFRNVFGPMLGLVILVAIFFVGLRMAVPLPIGPHYWEFADFLDAARRIADGQFHSVDYTARAGPLGYHLFAHGEALLPEAHPLLLAQFAPMILTVPLMALIILDVARRAPGTAWALMLPFALFSVLPFNLTEYSLPGVDGAGVVNRQAAQVLYVLACTLIFCRNPVVICLGIALSCLALFLLAISAFAAGIILLGFAILAGRIGWGPLLCALIVFYAGLGWLEFRTGFVFAYIQHFITLAKSGGDFLSDSLAGTVHASLKFIAPGLALLAAMLWYSRSNLLPAYVENVIYVGRRRAINAVFNAPASWIAASLLVCIVFEIRGAGGQGYIALWPAVWLAVLRLDDFRTRGRGVVAVLLAATLLPGAMDILGRALSTAARAPFNPPLAAQNLRGLGMVTVPPGSAADAETLRNHFVRHRRAYMELAESGSLPSYPPAWEGYFQIVWLQELDRLAAAVREWETEHGRKLAQVFTADRADPLPWLLDRQPVRNLPIGVDRFGLSPPPGPETIDTLRDSDAIFLPRCPETTTRLALRTRIMPALEGRQAIEITSCYTMMLKREPR